MKVWTCQRSSNSIIISETYKKAKHIMDLCSIIAEKMYGSMEKLRYQCTVHYSGKDQIIMSFFSRCQMLMIILPDYNSDKKWTDSLAPTCCNLYIFI